MAATKEQRKAKRARRDFEMALTAYTEIVEGADNKNNGNNERGN